MKKIILVLLAALGATAASAQTQAAYFMEGSTFRTQLNPAFAPRKGYLNLPALGGVQFNMTGNIGLGHFLFPYNGELVTIFDRNITAAQALGGLHAKNALMTDTRVNLFGIGNFMRDHRTFWSFDMSIRTETEINLPYALFEFMKRGSNHVVANNLGLTAQSYVETGFSYSWQVNDKIYVGARGKFLVGAARGRLAIDRLEMTMLEDVWSLEGTGSMEMVGPMLTPSTREDGTEYYDPMDIHFGSSFKIPAGYGFGIDLGATYDVLPDLQVSLAVNDLGLMAWNKKATSLGRMTKSQSFSGVEIVNGEASDVEFDVGQFEFDRVNSTGSTKSLKSSINAGGEYKLWRRKIGLGLLYNVRFWETRTFHNITASANFTPIDWFTLGVNYSFLNNRGHGLGFAINACPSWINFFLATDVVLVKRTPQGIPTHSSSMNVTFGLGIPIGKRNHRHLPVNQSPLTY